MLYFSELEGKTVVTEDKIKVGLLNDIIFLASDQPKATKLVIMTPAKTKIFVPYEYVRKMNSNILIEKSFQESDLKENELYIHKNLLDKQIIDIVGNKVVRVNDVILQERSLVEGRELYVTGVDIGTLGIIRRLKLEAVFLRFFSIIGAKFTSHFLSWADIQPLELSHGHIQLKKAEEKLENMRPEDLADYLEKTNELNIRKFLKLLDSKLAIKVIGNLNINYQRDLFQHWQSEKGAKLMEDIDPDTVADILLAVRRKKREELLGLLSPDKKAKLEHLLAYSRTPIGKRMTSQFFTVQSGMTVREVIDKLKKETTNFSFLATIYVLNSNRQLVGVCNPHELLLQDLEAPIYKFMIQNLIEIRLTTPAEIAVKKMLKYRLPVIPVVDDDKRLIGIVTFDDVTDIIQHSIEQL